MSIIDILAACCIGLASITLFFGLLYMSLGLALSAMKNK